MKAKLFDEDDSENEVTFKSSSEYAKKYNTLRRKEELLKLKNKFGAEAVDLHESESSEDDDDEEVVLSEVFERDFFKTLSYLKKKDPKIYDNKVRFFDDDHTSEPSTSKGTKEKSMTIRDYNRKAILETGGKFSEDEDNEDNELENGRSSPSYVQEQKQIKTMFSSVLEESEEEDNIGGMFVKKNKTKQEEAEEEKKYLEWLAGEGGSVFNQEEEKELNALKEYWSNPTLDEGEAFLRDYFINQRYKEHRNKDYIPSYEDIVNDADDISEDEKLVGRQTEFEHKFNFRFEEPDQEFIKRYPRTLEHSMRHKENKRAQKRAEVKERKAEEKKKKKEEIAQLKSLKLKEIQEKIEKLKDITGNDQLAFKDEDIEGDFDPEEHDRRMRELFNEDYYGEEADDEKPIFPDLDEELEIDDWDRWNVNGDGNTNSHVNEDEPHCEYDNFNMDCDYDATKSKQENLLRKQLEEPEGRRRKRKRKNQLAQALAKKKPVFDPDKMDKTFAEYLDEYYKLDCEDVIGDMPCRFKYREVPPCDYGLSTAEILMADDSELNRWYPLKKTLQYRPEHKQRNDQQVYASKARNLNLKKKILPSLFKEEVNENEPTNEDNMEPESSSKKKRNKRKKKKNQQSSGNNNDETIQNTVADENKMESKKKKNQQGSGNNNVETIQNTVADENKMESKKKKNQQGSGNNNVETIQNTVADENKMESKKKKNQQGSGNNNVETIQNTVAEEIKRKSKKKRNKEHSSSDNVETNDNTGVGEKKKQKHHNEVNVKEEISNNANMESSQKKKKSKHYKDEESNVTGESVEDSNVCNDSYTNKKAKKRSRDDELEMVDNSEASPKEKKKKKNKNVNIEARGSDKKGGAMQGLSDERLKAYGLNPKKYRNFIKYKKH